MFPSLISIYHRQWFKWTPTRLGGRKSTLKILLSSDPSAGWERTRTKMTSLATSTNCPLASEPACVLVRKYETRRKEENLTCYNVGPQRSACTRLEKDETDWGEGHSRFVWSVTSYFLKNAARLGTKPLSKLRGGEREGERQRQRDRDRDRETERQRERERERENEWMNEWMNDIYLNSVFHQ